MPINAVQFGSLYSVNAIKHNNAKQLQGGNQVNNVKEIELHPTIKGDGIRANKLDFLC